MIELRQGDLFKSEAQALVNPVNCVGIAGKGLAKEFKKRWPESYFAYRHYCDLGRLAPGTLFTWTDARRTPDLRIIHLPTKRHWRDKSLLEDIELGLFELRSLLISMKIKSVAIPALGCGNGGLDWRNVRAAMHTILIQSKSDIYIYEPEKP